jgi:lysophospholipase-3
LDASVARNDSCQKRGGSFELWASANEVLNHNTCFNVYTKLELNDNGTVSNATGVSIVPRDFGGVGGVEYIDPTLRVAYLHQMIVAFEKVGYTRGVNLRAAPFDFRTTGLAETLQQQQQRLVTLIEQTAALNKGRPVVLVCHSLGAVLVNHMLTRGSGSHPAWKARFVRGVTYLAAPLKGTPGAIRDIISGPQMPLTPAFLPRLVVPAIRTMPSVLWMLPAPADAGFWSAPAPAGGTSNPAANPSGNGHAADAAATTTAAAAAAALPAAFIRTPARNYTVEDTPSWLQAMNASALHALWAGVTPNFIGRDEDPGVAVFCGYAVDSATSFTLDFKGGASAMAAGAAGAVAVSTGGDGTVSVRSLRWCGRWVSSAQRPVDVREYRIGKGQGAHVQIVQDKGLIADVVRWVAAL